jgi:hypothetical protein
VLLIGTFVLFVILGSVRFVNSRAVREKKFRIVEKKLSTTLSKEDEDDDTI